MVILTDVPGQPIVPRLPRFKELYFCSFWILEPLKMGPIGCTETSVRNYHHTLRNITEERRYHLLRGGSLKSRIVVRRFLRSEFKYFNQF